MANKMIVAITRKWHNPQIKIVVTSQEEMNDGISLEMDLQDFKEAVKKEIGSVAWIFTQETFDAKVDAAFDKVVSGIKYESRKAV